MKNLPVVRRIALLAFVALVVVLLVGAAQESRGYVGGTFNL